MKQATQAQRPGRIIERRIPRSFKGATRTQRNKTPATMTMEQCGVFFGYPACCIDAFVNPFTPLLDRTAMVRTATRNGFVPCEKHAHKLMAGTATYKGIMKGRVCSVGFEDNKY